MLKETFAAGLKHCNELNGTNFFFPPRDRVLDLDEYHRSLENLAKQQVYNPERRRPWTKEDAAERWEQVQRQAAQGQRELSARGQLARTREAARGSGEESRHHRAKEGLSADDTVALTSRGRVRRLRLT